MGVTKEGTSISDESERRPDCQVKKVIGLFILRPFFLKLKGSSKNSLKKDPEHHEEVV